MTRIDADEEGGRRKPRDMAAFADDDAPPAPATLTTDEDQDDDVDVQVGDLGDLDDLAEADDDDDMRRALYARVAADDDIDDDFLSAASPPETHRHQFGSALAQLPPPKDDENEITASGEGFDYLYDSPASSPRATASSTALIMASTSSTTTVGPLIGPAPKGTAAGAMNRRALNRNPFTGLSNQGATCYMNSLLQTMFMTPELRLGLYRWTFTEEEDENEEDNIPFQLQKLFAKLQMNTQESISTKALTKSFGWTGADVFQQHDVQELCRVLFDALEKSFKGTETETLVNDLYQGTMKDYVQCRTCGYESSRNDEFLDLSLVIRPFGSSKMMKSIEEAIEFFLKPELLNGDNQWMCDRCKTKRDAIKGLKFSKLPYLLSLQLKRFDYDYMTDSRVKLHDQVTFPKYLDMNSYLHDEEGGGTRGSIARKMSMERHELESHAALGDGTFSARDRRMSSMDESQPVMAFSDDEGLPSSTVVSDTWSPIFDLDGLIEKAGPYVYELYSVLIHSGSALGGHYYAYIKSFENDKWYDFNDSNVSELSENEVKKAWGGNGSNTYGGRISYSTCAYMLMYRQVNHNKNVNSVSKESIPQYLVERMREEDERQRRQELERIELTKKMLIKFYMKTNSKNKIEKSIHIYKTATLREALVLAHETFKNELQGAMPSINNTRIRLYNDYTGLLSDTYEDREDKTLQQLQMYSSYQLYLETKKDDERWESHDPTRLQLFVRRFNLTATGDPIETDLSIPDMSARYVQVEEDSTIGSFTEILARKFDVPEGKKIRLVRKTGSSYTSYTPTPVKILNPDESPQTLNLRLRMDLHLVNGSEVYFEECDDLSSPSIAAAHFEREINMIDLNVWFEERLAKTIRIDRRKTLRELKEEIAKRLNLPADKFKILRGNHRASLELKNIDTALVKVPIGQGSALYIVEGTPLGPGEYLFRLLLLKSPARAIAPSQESLSGRAEEPTVTVSSKTDGGDEERDLFDIDEVLVRVKQDESELEYVASIKAGEEHSVDSIRQTVWVVLKENGKIPDDNSVTPKHVRLRDVQATTLTTILVDGCDLKDASSSPVYEGRGMVAQILPEPEQIGLGHRLLQVVYVDRSKWRFCKRRRFELIIPKEQVGEDASTDEEDDDDAGNPTTLAISTVGQRGKPPVSSQVNTWVPDQIAARLTIPPEQARFAVFTVDRDSFDICEIYKTDFDTWERCMANLRDRQYNYQLLVFVADADVPMGSFSLRERSSVQDFLVKKRDDSYKTSERSYSNYSNYRKPKEAALVIRTKTSKKGGSSASSTDNTSGDVRIRTPTQRRTSKSAASDTDEDDEVNLYD